MRTHIKSGKRSLLIVALLISFLFASQRPALAANTINVTGEAAVRVVPDEVIMALGIETWDKDLNTAKTQNDAIIAKLKALATQYQIKPEKVQTDFVNIEPRYHDDYEKRQFIGYFVRKTLIITLNDITKFDDVLSGALLAGANYVHGIEFRTTELRKYRDQARAMAIKAAREKADALAAELGLEVTKALSISESGAGWFSSYGSYWGSHWGGMQSQNVAQNVSSGSAGDFSDSTIALGQITVSASVSVQFEVQPKSS